MDLIGDRTREKNRIEKFLDAGIKLSVVASDIFGVSGRAMMEAVIAGDRDPTVLADLARTRLRAKLPQLREALTGHFSDHHAFLLAQMLSHVDDLDQRIAIIEGHLDNELAPFSDELARLDEIPGIGRPVAAQILAEIGTDMTRFPHGGPPRLVGQVQPDRQGIRRQTQRQRRDRPREPLPRQGTSLTPGPDCRKKAPSPT